MATVVHVTVATNECGGIGFALIKSNIEASVGALEMDIDLTIDAVVFNRPTGAVLPPEHAGDAEKLAAVEALARDLKASRIPGAIGLAGTMVASRLLEILRGDL